MIFDNTYSIISLNINILQSAVTVMIKFFAVKIQKIQQDSSSEISAEIVINKISVITSLITALKSSLKYCVSSIEKI
ncbi:hypothetical protein I7I48_00362 [Histoplasma ohiense]|nr:hypothetical protein I7I48_00362 [Histoplasma ohiense (nom. inval.)]